jgi:hypothetical protein
MSDEKEPEIIDLDTMKETPILTTRERLLSTDLTDDEWRERDEQWQKDYRTMRDLKDVEDARRKVFNGQHKGRETDFDNLARIVAAKAEDRDVEVKTYAILDGTPDSHLALTVRTDTGEVLNRRALRADEIDQLSQQPLPLQDGEPTITLPVNPEDIGPGTKLEGYAEALAAGTIEELPPEAGEPEPLPKSGRDLAAYIKAGKADAHLEALSGADTRKGVIKAVKARREALLAADISDAEEPKPAKNL